MRSFSRATTMFCVAVCATALSGCGKPETKTGSLVQRFAMVDKDGVQYGMVEFDPAVGGSVVDAQGRLIGRITPAAPVAVASAQPLAALPY